MYRGEWGLPFILKRFPVYCFIPVFSHRYFEISLSHTKRPGQWNENYLSIETSLKNVAIKFVLRAGSELHQALAIRALNQGESLNSYVVKALKKIVLS